MWKSRSSTLSSSWMAELTLSLRESPAVLRRKLICATHIHNSHSFSHNQNFVTVGAVRNIDKAVNRELDCHAHISLHQDQPVQLPHHCSWVLNTSMNFLLLPLLVKRPWDTHLRMEWELQRVPPLSDLEVLILIPATSHSAVNHSSASWRPPPDGVNRTTLSRGHKRGKPPPTAKYSAHNSYEQNHWQRALLAESNAYREEVWRATSMLLQQLYRHQMARGNVLNML